MQKILTLLLLLFAGVCLGMMLTKSCQNPVKEPEIKIEKDTLIVTRIDTIVQVLPRAVKIIRDTVEITDTILIAGQTFFQEVKEYQDSTYYARISGINAYLEEIRVYPKTITQYVNTKEYVYIPPKKWSIAIQGGIGITPKGVQPYLGFGVSRRLEF